MLELFQAVLKQLVFHFLNFISCKAVSKIFMWPRFHEVYCLLGNLYPVWRDTNTMLCIINKNGIAFPIIIHLKSDLLTVTLDVVIGVLCARVHSVKCIWKAFMIFFNLIKWHTVVVLPHFYRNFICVNGLNLSYYYFCFPFSPIAWASRMWY